MVVENEVAISHARIAVYDDLLSSPRVIEVTPTTILDFIEKIAITTYEQARALGGSLPYTVIREIAENFIHADFKECIVSVLNSGNTVRFADQGPGIEKKDLVLQPGVSSATAAMKQYIRGVGSGFPIVREYLERVNGYLSVDDNALDGTVITLTILASSSMPSVHAVERPALRYEGAVATPYEQQFSQRAWAPQAPFSAHVPSAPQPVRPGSYSSGPQAQAQQLKTREERVLSLLYREGMLGSGDLVEPLGISAPTATRILQRLEHLGYVETSTNKKRILSNKGLAYIQTRSQSI